MPSAFPAGSLQHGAAIGAEAVRACNRAEAARERNPEVSPAPIICRMGHGGCNPAVSSRQAQERMGGDTEEKSPRKSLSCSPPPAPVDGKELRHQITPNPNKCLPP